MATNKRLFSICGVSFCVECDFPLATLSPFPLTSSKVCDFSIINIAHYSLHPLSELATNGLQLYYSTTIRGVEYSYYGNSFCRYFSMSSSFADSLYSASSSCASYIIWYMQEHRFVSYSTEEHSFMYLLWTAFVWESLSKDILPIHSSTVVCNELGVMFLGTSGAGKSTQSHLWLESIVGTTFLNDDSPFIFVWKGTKEGVGSLLLPEVWVSGSAWSGKSNVFVNEQYRVWAMVAVRKSGYNSVRLLSAKERVGVIVRAVPPFLLRDRLFYGSVLALVSAVAQYVRCVELQCLPNVQAAILLHQYLTSLQRK